MTVAYWHRNTRSAWSSPSSLSISRSSPSKYSQSSPSFGGFCPCCLFAMYPVTHCAEYILKRFFYQVGPWRGVKTLNTSFYSKHCSINGSHVSVIQMGLVVTIINRRTRDTCLLHIVHRLQSLLTPPLRSSFRSARHYSQMINTVQGM